MPTYNMNRAISIRDKRCSTDFN